MSEDVAADGPLVVVLATANPGKAVEMRAVIESFGVDVDLRPRPEDVPDVEEDAPDLVGNARLKAAALVAATGLPAVADDTGLEVDALHGQPGVRSARYAGEPADDAANRARLLAELETTPHPSDRTARFRTVVVLQWPDGRELVAEGVCEGSIAPAESGERGFGYDPVFVPSDGDGRTFAAMERDEKDAISHRGRALRSLAGLLAAD